LHTELTNASQINSEYISKIKELEESLERQNAYIEDLRKKGSGEQNRVAP
jgi:hypothetical protein